MPGEVERLKHETQVMERSFTKIETTHCDISSLNEMLTQAQRVAEAEDKVFSMNPFNFQPTDEEKRKARAALGETEAVLAAAFRAVLENCAGKSPTIPLPTRSDLDFAPGPGRMGTRP